MSRLTAIRNVEVGTLNDFILKVQVLINTQFYHMRHGQYPIYESVNNTIFSSTYYAVVVNWRSVSPMCPGLHQDFLLQSELVTQSCCQSVTVISIGCAYHVP